MFKINEFEKIFNKFEIVEEIKCEEDSEMDLRVKIESRDLKGILCVNKEFIVFHLINNINNVNNFKNKEFIISNFEKSGLLLTYEDEQEVRIYEMTPNGLFYVENGFENKIVRSLIFE